jgi:hypothetical protein
MAPKKIKIVEIHSESNEINQVPEIVEEPEGVEGEAHERSETNRETPLNDDVEADDEEIQTVVEETVEPPTKEPHKFNRKSGKQIPSKERLDELVSCKKCGKMVLEKTLNYSHLKSCVKHDEEFIPVAKLNVIKKIKANIPKEVPKTSLVQTPTVLSQAILPQPSYQDMRRDYHRTRVTEKSENMKKLFMNAI